MRQLNVRVAPFLLERYRLLLRDLEDEHTETSLAEVVQAVLFSAPSSASEMRTLIRAWRDVRDPLR